MKGTDQVRFCSDCQKYVYNLSEMTRREAETILATRGNQMCARLIRDLEGQTMTVESLPPIRLMSQRPGRIANAVVTTLISITPLGAPLASAKISPHDAPSVDTTTSGTKRLSPDGMQSAITGVITDENDAPIAGALVTLTTESTGEMLSQLTSDGGEFRFDGLPAHTYLVEVRYKGYEVSKHHEVILQKGEVRRFDLAMEKQVVLMGVVTRVPQPLRILYKNSDRVVVAVVGKRTVASRDGSNLTKIPLNVLRTIKGDGHKPALDVVYTRLDHMNQGYLVEGETVLAFLQRNDASTSESSSLTYALASDPQPVKQLSAADLQAYVQRLDELRAIIGNSESQPADIVDWLVRCAEDPRTRHEAAYELVASIRRAYWKADSERRAQAGERIRAPRDEEPFYADLLTDEQRSRLTDAVLESEELGEGEFELIEVLSRWNDSRLLSFLVAYLKRQQESAPREIDRIMKFIADSLNRDDLKKLLREYVENASYEDLDTDEDAADLGAESEEVSSEEENSEETSDTADQDEIKTKLTPEAAKRARVEMLKSFLNAVQAHMQIGTSK
jgi:hypothetical protein